MAYYIADCFLFDLFLKFIQADKQESVSFILAAL